MLALEIANSPGHRNIESSAQVALQKAGICLALLPSHGLIAIFKADTHVSRIFAQSGWFARPNVSNRPTPPSHPSSCLPQFISSSTQARGTGFSIFGYCLLCDLKMLFYSLNLHLDRCSALYVLYARLSLVFISRHVCTRRVYHFRRCTMKTARIGDI